MRIDPNGLVIGRDGPLACDCGKLLHHDSTVVVPKSPIDPEKPIAAVPVVCECGAKWWKTDDPLSQFFIEGLFGGRLLLPRNKKADALAHSLDIRDTKPFGTPETTRGA